jgi:hypothetical protein
LKAWCCWTATGRSDIPAERETWETSACRHRPARPCHQYPPSQRGTSRIIETRGGTLLRTVIPIHNRQACYGCHDASQKINGILILDYDAGQIHAAMSKDLRWMVLGTGLIGLLLVGAIALVVRVRRAAKIAAL